MSELKRELKVLGLQAELPWQDDFLYKAFLALPFSKLSCPHYTSFFLRKRKKLKHQKVIFHSFANLNSDFFFRSDRSIKRVLTVHDIIPLLAKEKSSYFSYFQFRFFLRSALSAVDKVLCVSEWTRSCLEKEFPEFSLKYEVLGNGFLKPAFSRLSLAHKKTSDDKLEILCVSRFEGYKRFDLCLDILEAERAI